MTEIIDLRDAVRKRPGMYVGGTDQRAMRHLIYEVMDHMVEEAAVGHCTQITMELRDDNVVILEDNSRGLPVDIDPEHARSKLELIVSGNKSPLHYRGKGQYDPTVYVVAGGLHGLGLSVVNCLSSYMTVENKRDGYVWRQEYVQGEPTTELIRGKTTSETGTTFTFQPDPTIFVEFKPYDPFLMMARCRDLAYNVAGLKITLRDARVGGISEMEFQKSGGLRDYVSDLTSEYTNLHAVAHVQDYMPYAQKDAQQRELMIGIEFAFQFIEQSQGHIKSFVNTVRTVEDSSHRVALQRGILTELNAVLFELNAYAPPILWEEIQDKLVAVIALKHPEPQFESPTKTILMNPEVEEPIQRLLARYFRDNRSQMMRVVQALISSRGR